LAGVGGFEMGGVGGGVTGAAAATGAMAASAGRHVLSARAMVNPRVSMWLADTANVATKGQAQQQLRKLGTIISREPALAHELQPVYNFLNERLAMPLAAQPNAEGQQNDN